MSSLSPGMTVAQTRRALTDAFRQAGLDSPELDARLLTGHALDLDHTALASEPDASSSTDSVPGTFAIRTLTLALPRAIVMGPKSLAL